MSPAGFIHLRFANCGICSSTPGRRGAKTALNRRGSFRATAVTGFVIEAMRKRIESFARCDAFRADPAFRLGEVHDLPMAGHQRRDRGVATDPTSPSMEGELESDRWRNQDRG